MKDVNKRVKIKYPCKLTYKIIGNEYELIVGAIKDILSKSNEKHYKIGLSKKSKSAKYFSVNLNVIINDETTRLKYYKELSKHKNIKIVI